MHIEGLRRKPVSRAAAQAAGETDQWLDWGVALGSLWLITGLHLDGWAHHHMQLESFFTPWHAVLYSGFAVTAAVVGLGFLRGIRQGRPWREALPRAYMTSLLGTVIFLVGGVADLTWHTLFGIELSLDALLSPPHLVLALGAALLITGPLRSALYQPGEKPSPGLPALISATMLLGLLAFFTGYASPWQELSDRASGGFGFRLVSFSQSEMITAVLLQAALEMGIVLLLVRRFRLPFGMLTLFFGVSTALAVSAHTNWSLVPLAGVAGLAGDILARVLVPQKRGWGMRLFAFLLPTMLYGLFFGALKISGGLDGWVLQLWTGTILLAGVVGWLVSYLVIESEGPSKM